MAITDEIVKTLKNPTPLYALAGTADLTAEKLQQVPALIEKIRAEAPERIEKIRSTDPKTVQQRVAAQAKEAQAKAQARVTEALGTIELDLKKFRESAQDLALQGVGRAAEYAVKARETYDGLAERGKEAVATWRGETAEHVEDLAVAIEPSPEPHQAQAREQEPQAESAPVNGSAKSAPARKPPARKASAKKPPVKAAE